MKKILSFVLCLSLLLAACGNKNEASSSKNDSKERTFTTESGDKVKIPKNPKRILLLTANYGNLKKLGVEPIGITSVFPDSKYLDMKDVKKVDPEDVEAAAKLKPDLIVTYKENKNNNKLSKIAPTVSLKVQDTDYKGTHIEYGKLVNKEEKAKKQAEDLSDKLLKDGKEIKKHIGEDKTASIMDVQAKDIYQFGARFGRGSDAIYDGFKLKEDPEAKKAMPAEKFMKVPKEKYNDYSGDYLFIPTKDGKKPNIEFTESTIWKNNKAVKNGNVIYYTSDEAIYGDLISVEKQAETFKKELLKK